MARWIEVADGVLVRRYEELDLSVGLVVGTTAAWSSTPGETPDRVPSSRPPSAR